MVKRLCGRSIKRFAEDHGRAGGVSIAMIPAKIRAKGYSEPNGRRL